MTQKTTCNMLWAGFKLSAVLLAFFIAGCGNPKKIVYFRDLPDSLNYIKSVTPVEYVEQKIQVSDILNITIQTIDQKSTEMLAGAGSSAAGVVPGYVVDNEGYIEIPLIGRLKVAGKTLNETKELLREAAHKYYKDPVVNVRIANAQITVLGEVNHPGTVTLPKDKIGMVDAIGLAGDLTAYGKRDNILLIREQDGKKEFIRVNINSTDIYRSPYYYVRNGDVIYVEPNTVRARNSTIDYSRERYFSYAVSLISLTLTIINFIHYSK